MKNYIKYLLEENNMTMKDLSVILGISQSAVSQWNENNISLENLYKLSRLFRVSMEDIINRVYPKEVDNYYHEELIELQHKYRVLENINYNNISNNLNDVVECLASLASDYEYYSNYFETIDLGFESSAEEFDKQDSLSLIIDYLNSLVVEVDEKEKYFDEDNLSFNNLVFKDYYKIKKLDNEKVKLLLMSYMNKFELDKMATKYYYENDYDNLKYALSLGANIFYTEYTRKRHITHVNKDADLKHMIGSLGDKFYDNMIDEITYYDVEKDKFSVGSGKYCRPNVRLTYFLKAKMTISDPGKAWKQYLKYVKEDVYLRGDYEKDFI